MKTGTTLKNLLGHIVLQTRYEWKHNVFHTKQMNEFFQALKKKFRTIYRFTLRILLVYSITYISIKMYSKGTIIIMESRP